MRKRNSSRKSNCNSNVSNEDKNTQDYSNRAGDRCIYIYTIISIQDFSPL